MKEKTKFIKLLNDNRIKKNIIEAFEKVKQEDYFDSIFQELFYSKEPVPIGLGEKSDPPIVLAKMINYLSPKKSWRVLEIGTGSGYSTALLSQLVKEVFTSEFHEELAGTAKERMIRKKIGNVKFFSGDGTNFDEAPEIFDAIIIYAACQKRPLTLMNNLKEGGTLVLPMGTLFQQQITVIENTPDGNNESIYKTRFYEFCTFGPLQGKYSTL